MSTQIAYEDPTRGMTLVSTRDQNLAVTRYLFFAGQVIDPDRVSQLEYIRSAGGGEEVQTHCMRRTTNGLLPRARLTPLEVWTDALPQELVAEGAEGETVHMVGQTVPVNARPNSLIGKPLSLVKFYPGDEIKSILRASRSGGDKGIVEIPSLMGQGWYADEAETRPGVAQVLNRDFFPVTPPIELKRLEEMIDKGSARSPLHAQVANEMRQSCALFRRWAEATLATEHVLLRERRSHQFTYTYSPIARELLRQLEMKPQDSLFEQSTADFQGLAEAIVNAQKGRGGGLGVADIGEIVRQVLAAVAQPTASATELEKMKRPQLTELGAQVGVKVTPGMSNAEAVAAIRAAQTSTPAE